jgi:hypothetical protein
MKSGVIRRLATKTLKRNTTPKDRRRLNINQISGSRNSLSPKVRWIRGGNYKSTSSLKQMAMLSAQQPHSEHEHPDKKIELEYPAQQAPGEEHQIDTLMQNLHERHE